MRSASRCARPGYSPRARALMSRIHGFQQPWDASSLAAAAGFLLGACNRGSIPERCHSGRLGRGRHRTVEPAPVEGADRMCSGGGACHLPPAPRSITSASDRGIRSARANIIYESLCSMAQRDLSSIRMVMFWARVVDFSWRPPLDPSFPWVTYDPVTGAHLMIGATLQKAVLQSAPWAILALIVFTLAWLPWFRMPEARQRQMRLLSLVTFALIATFAFAGVRRHEGSVVQSTLPARTGAVGGRRVRMGARRVRTCGRQQSVYGSVVGCPARRARFYRSRRCSAAPRIP